MGITPEPYRPGTLSKSMCTASQLVIPPANPNTPAASTHRVQRTTPSAFISTPATISANVAAFDKKAFV